MRTLNLSTLADALHMDILDIQHAIEYNSMRTCERILCGRTAAEDSVLCTLCEDALYEELLEEN